MTPFWSTFILNACLIMFIIAVAASGLEIWLGFTIPGTPSWMIAVAATLTGMLGVGLIWLLKEGIPHANQ